MKVTKRALFLGSIWPEARASAASNRSLDIIRALGQAGYIVSISADGRENAATETLRLEGHSCVRLLANDESFDRFVEELKPDLCIFDRFTTEEKFSWRVRQSSPDTLRILDTIDLHFIRQARQKAFESGDLAYRSGPELFTLAGDLACREVAAIYRSDRSLIVSDFERHYLTDICSVPGNLLDLCRLEYSEPKPGLSFAERQGYAMIGNFRHPPNEDAVYWLKESIWPKIRAQQPDAFVHVWGAHAQSKHLALTDAAQGFFVKGSIDDQFAELAQRRVNLAPLRYGAGIKGKIADGWFVGTPVITSPVGAEGMHEDCAFGGLLASSAEAIADAALTLYHKEELWRRNSEFGMQTLRELYTPAATSLRLIENISHWLAERDRDRQQNFTGQILWQQGLRCTEYFSRWIAEKNRR